MPLIINPDTTTPPFFAPKNNYAVSKYLDLTKFVSMLQRKSLFFCRLDKLEDAHEGITAKANHSGRVAYYQELNKIGFFKKPLTQEDIDNFIKESEAFENTRKSLVCVNCWNVYDGESMALWKIYSDPSKGIMIQSTINQIKDAFQESEHKILISEVRYKDYKKEKIPDGNLVYPVIHKRKAFSFENEIRMIHEVSSVNWVHDWENEEVKEGVFIPVNLSALITEIRISPFSPDWFRKMVEGLCVTHGLNISVLPSDLS
jgi:hypothetical protein